MQMRANGGVCQKEAYCDHRSAADREKNRADQIIVEFRSYRGACVLLLTGD
jgi:hypothetical protein